MVDTMRVARHSIVHKPPTGWIKHGNRVAERVKRARRGLTKTHSVASEAVEELRFGSVSLSGFGNEH